MDEDMRAIVGGVIGAIMFFGFAWGLSFFCVTIGYGPEVCGW